MGVVSTDAKPVLAMPVSFGVTVNCASLQLAWHKIFYPILRLTSETFGGNRHVIGAALVRSRIGCRSIVVAFADGTAIATERRERLRDGAVVALEGSEIR